MNLPIENHCLSRATTLATVTNAYKRRLYAATFSRRVNTLTRTTTTTTTTTRTAADDNINAAATTTTTKTANGQLNYNDNIDNDFNNDVENARKIECVILSLRNTHLNFNKIQKLQKKRLRHLQNLIKNKNETISQLIAQLELFKPLLLSSSKSKNNSNSTKNGNNINNNGSNGNGAGKYLGVVKCANIIRTVTGGEKFVRRRLAELCTLHNGEHIYCQKRADTENDRLNIGKLLETEYGASVILYEKSKRFEFIKQTDVDVAKCLILNYLHHESHTKINTD
ncbi:bv/odv-e26 [Catopsilia pomona nucleopolyhedrovirus]|uniref:Bv/odv-e26 n=1 Tax=Catopsilia pomona nucleopolyhedrovirus TaxID=1850906 RepID=A0A172WZJ9_9ABAC|nr:bv/odv-e26 [Catopsilia pomona nucleopolyhedrovirus]ANF29770.1 bv/odv-e26 [Catopsilia pomona nucleopolyhedrovirus]